MTKPNDKAVEKANHIIMRCHGTEISSSTQTLFTNLIADAITQAREEGYEEGYHDGFNCENYNPKGSK